MKPYYRKKGSYNDGRMKVVVEEQIKDKKITKNLPKPEIMLKVMDWDGWKNLLEEIKQQKRTTKIVHLVDTKCTTK